jgi:hypothetical protein
MIFPYQVKWVAEKYLRMLLSNYPSQLRVCMEDEKFPLWCRLCSERLNQLDLAGFVRSRAAVDHFIKTAVIAYAKHQLKKASLKVPTQNNSA